MDGRRWEQGGGEGRAAPVRRRRAATKAGPGAALGGAPELR